MLNIHQTSCHLHICMHCVKDVQFVALEHVFAAHSCSDYWCSRQGSLRDRAGLLVVLVKRALISNRLVLLHNTHTTHPAVKHWKWLSISVQIFLFCSCFYTSCFCVSHKKSNKNSLEKYPAVNFFLIQNSKSIKAAKLFSSCQVSSTFFTRLKGFHES